MDKSIILAIPIGIIYNMVVDKISQIGANNITHGDKTQINLAILIIGGIVGIMIAMIFFNTDKMKNIKYGLFLGSLALFAQSVVFNWHIINDITKLGLFLVGLLTISYYAYQMTDNESKKIDKRHKKNKI